MASSPYSKSRRSGSVAGAGPRSSSCAPSSGVCTTAGDRSPANSPTSRVTSRSPSRQRGRSAWWAKSAAPARAGSGQRHPQLHAVHDRRVRAPATARSGRCRARRSSRSAGRAGSAGRCPGCRGAGSRRPAARSPSAGRCAGAAAPPCRAAPPRRPARSGRRSTRPRPSGAAAAAAAAARSCTAPAARRGPAAARCRDRRRPRRVAGSAPASIRYAPPPDCTPATGSASADGGQPAPTVTVFAPATRSRYSRSARLSQPGEPSSAPAATPSAARRWMATEPAPAAARTRTGGAPGTTDVEAGSPRRSSARSPCR